MNLTKSPYPDLCHLHHSELLLFVEQLSLRVSPKFQKLKYKVVYRDKERLVRIKSESCERFRHLRGK